MIDCLSSLVLQTIIDYHSFLLQTSINYLSFELQTVFPHYDCFHVFCFIFLYVAHVVCVCSYMQHIQYEFVLICSTYSIDLQIYFNSRCVFDQINPHFSNFHDHNHFITFQVSFFHSYTFILMKILLHFICPCFLFRYKLFSSMFSLKLK